MLLLLSALALACPWGPSPAVSVSMVAVQIDGVRYPVRGPVARSALGSQLRECRLPEAVDALERWRSSRRTTNVLAGIGAGLGYPLLAVPFAAHIAGRRAEVLEVTIRQGARP